MNQFTIYTLVDITRTNQYRKELGREKQKLQQQNFDMLIQTIGMRANPSFVEDPVVSVAPVTAYNFGNQLSGIHTIWTFQFYIEHENSLTDETGNLCGFLIEDLQFVPIITGLDETCSFETAIFNTKSRDYCNTIILSR